MIWFVIFHATTLFPAFLKIISEKNAGTSLYVVGSYQFIVLDNFRPDVNKEMLNI